MNATRSRKQAGAQAGSGIPVSEMNFPPVLLYHKVSPCPELGITRTTPHGFRRQMKFLSDKGFKLHSLTSLTSLYKTVTPGASFPENLISLTFDDAYLNVYQYALPVLKENGFTATVFVPVNYIGEDNIWDDGRFGLRFKHMGKSELREWVASGGEVGCHGASHTHLKLVASNKRYREIGEAGKHLEDLLGVEVRWFAPPFGWYDRHVLELAGDAGYTGIAVVCGRKSVTCPPGLMLVERQPVYLGDPRFLIQAKVSTSSALNRIERSRQLVIHAGNRGTVAVQAMRKRLRDHGNSA